jgi:hypothetical protein
MLPKALGIDTPNKGIDTEPLSPSSAYDVGIDTLFRGIDTKHSGQIVHSS